MGVVRRSWGKVKRWLRGSEPPDGPGPGGGPHSASYTRARGETDATRFRSGFF
jgi:hypothetical protein